MLIVYFKRFENAIDHLSKCKQGIRLNFCWRSQAYLKILFQKRERESYFYILLYFKLSFWRYKKK